MPTPTARTAGGALLAAALVLAAAPLAAADTLTLDGDVLTGHHVAFGSVCQDEPAQLPLAVVVKRSGKGNVFASSALVTLAPAANGGASYSGASVRLPGDWVEYDGNGGIVNVNVSNGDTSLPADGSVSVDTGTVGDFNTSFKIVSSGTLAAGDAPQANVSVDWTVEDCSPPIPANHAPVVSAQAPDAIGEEGDTLSTHGAFTDPDGDPLTLSAGPTVGTFTDNADGTFTWSLGTDDDVAPGEITVTASDGQATVSQSFAYSASNVAPVVTTTATATAACTVSLATTFTDAGTADTHTGWIAWGDGTSTASAPVTSPMAGSSHTYSANGTYSATVTVTDDDGGIGSDSEAFATKLTPGALMQPINAAGTRSVFKLGSTIPVKITVTGCDGGLVTTLTPTVSLTRLDTNPDGTTNETAADVTPTNGLKMRWSDTLYIYNLSTKLSQQTGSALTAGTYRVSVNDDSFYAPTTAVIDLRK